MDALAEKIWPLLTAYGLRVLTAVVILVLGRWIAKSLTAFLRRIMNRSGVDETLVSFIANLSYVALLAIVVIAALNQLGIQTASLIAILGAAGLAIGLALQGSLSNLAAGVMMVIFRPFKVGDYIEGGGSAGTVEEIQIFTTQLKSPDNKTIIIPNSTMMSDVIVNYSTKETRRVDMVFGIGYEDDIDRAREIIIEILESDDRVHKEPAPLVAVSELADSSVNFTVRVWTASGEYWGVFFDTTEAVKKRFDDAGISIPFPQQDVHVYEHQE
jgi:small conductance mechanosensitive channel